VNNNQNANNGNKTSPHSATVIRAKLIHLLDMTSQVTPHLATIVQQQARHPVLMAPKALPRVATEIQRTPPHPATLVQSCRPHAAKVAQNSAPNGLVVKALGGLETVSLPGLETLQRMEEKQPLVNAKREKFKKKTKERAVYKSKVDILRKQVTKWLSEYGHCFDRHVGLTNQELDDRGLELATTFETDNDLIEAAIELISINEDTLNDWYIKGEESRKVVWAYLSPALNVRGRRKMKRPSWHYEQIAMPQPPGFMDVDSKKLVYVIGVFDLDKWTGAPKGLVTCFPSDTNEVES
jgi:hypothetical protein